MTNRKTKWMALAATLVLGAGLLFAQGPRGRHGFGPGGPGGPGGVHSLRMLASHLNLTDAQKDQAKILFEASRKEAEPVMAQLKQGHEQMAAAVKAGKTDLELQQLASQQGVLMGQMAGIHAKAMARFYAQLTPEQRQKADELHENMKGMFEGRMQRHGKRAPAPSNQ